MDEVLTQYTSDAEAQKAFLVNYCGECEYSKKMAARRAGVPMETVKVWFSNPRFFRPLQSALKAAIRRKSEIQEVVIKHAIEISDAQILDCFQTNPVTNQIDILPLHEIPDRTRGAVKKLKMTRQRIKDDEGNTQYIEIFDIELHDKVKALQLLGTWSGIQETQKKLQGNGIAKIVGLKIITGNKPKELPHHAEETSDTKRISETPGQVLSEPKANGSAPGDWSG